MDFYTILSKYYHYIFPSNLNEKSFLDSHIIEKKSNALDIGCGIGNTSSFLKEHANHVVGIDLNPSMIAKAKANFPSIQFLALDMRQLEMLTPMTFDVITCFGNTLVHINNDDAQKVLQQVAKLANPNAQLFIQIINYDRIYKDKITSLPPIDHESVTMHRNYTLYDNYLVFSSSILDKETNELAEQEITLYPLYYKQLTAMLETVGFKMINSYSNFNQNLWNQDGYATIIHARKG